MCFVKRRYTFQFLLAILFLLSYHAISQAGLNNIYGEGINDIWAADQTNIYVVGEAGRIFKSDSRKWTPVEPLTANNLKAIWGSSDSNIFAVGDKGTVLHFNGITWQKMSVPTTQDLESVFGSSESDIFAVGRLGQILHFDGTSWSAMQNNCLADLVGIWAAASDDVYAIGRYNNTTDPSINNGSVVLHYDGDRWSQISISNATPLFYELKAIWGSSATDIHILGDAHWHFDGTSWSVEDPDMRGTDLWGISSSEIFARHTTYQSIYKYDGTTWTRIVDNTPSSINKLIAFNDDHLLGINVRNSSDIGVVYEYKAGKWKTSQLEPSGISDTWHAGHKEFYGVGYGGQITYYNGLNFSAMPSPAEYNLTSVWGASNTAIFAVGEQGTILHYNGQEWKLMASGTTSYFVDVSGNNAEDVVAITSDGTFFHFDGSSWTSIASGERYLSSVCADGAGGYYATSSDNLLKYDENSWSLISEETPRIGSYNKVVCVNPNDVWFQGAYDTVRYDGINWQPVPGGGHSLWGDSSDNMYRFVVNKLYHWDGTTWEQSSQKFMNSLGNKISGNSSNDLYVIHQHSNLSIMHYDGLSWAPIDQGGAGIGELFAVADNALYGAPATPGILRFYDGIKWNSVSLPEPVEIYSIWGSSSNDIYAGGNQRLSAGGEGVLFHFNGTSWDKVDTESLGVTAPILDIYGNASDDVYFNTKNHLFHYDGSDWSDISSELWDIGMSILNNIWVSTSGSLCISDSSYVACKNGGWFKEIIPRANTIWGSSSDNIYAAGRDGLFHYDGSSWLLEEETATGVTERRGVWGSGPTDIYYFPYHFDGSSWTYQDIYYGVGPDFRINTAVTGTTVGSNASEIYFNNSSDLYMFNGGYTLHTVAGQNGSIQPSGVIHVPVGDSQLTTIIPDLGYYIEKVIVDGVDIGSVETVNFENISDEHSVQAIFTDTKPEYTISYDPDTFYFDPVISPGDGQSFTVEQGEDVSFTIASEPGTYVYEVFIANPNDYDYEWTSLGSVASLSLNDIRHDYRILIEFERSTYQITSSSGENGSIDTEGTVDVLGKYSSTFNIIPETGYQVADVMVDGVSIGAVATYRFNNIISNHTISATFKEKDVYLVTSTTNVGGTITPAGPTPIFDGDDIQYNITPDPDYLIYNVIIDGVPHGMINTYTFNGVENHHTIYVMFRKIPDLSDWLSLATPTSEDMNDIWGTDSQYFAVGNNGTILKIADQNISQQSSETNEDLHAVWGSSLNNVTAVGNNGTIVHFNGSEWTSMQSPTTENIVDISGLSSTSVIATTETGERLSFNGTNWLLYGTEGFGFPDEGDIYTSVTCSRLDGVCIVGGIDVEGFTITDRYFNIFQSVSPNRTIFPLKMSIQDVWHHPDAGNYIVAENVFLLDTVGHNDSIDLSHLTSNELFGLTGDDNSNVLAVGANGCILYSQGIGWGLWNTTINHDFNAVHGNFHSGVYIVGDAGTLLTTKLETIPYDFDGNGELSLVDLISGLTILSGGEAALGYGYFSEQSPLGLKDIIELMDQISAD